MPSQAGTHAMLALIEREQRSNQRHEPTTMPGDKPIGDVARVLASQSSHTLQVRRNDAQWLECGAEPHHSKSGFGTQMRAQHASCLESNAGFRYPHTCATDVLLDVHAEMHAPI